MVFETARVGTRDAVISRFCTSIWARGRHADKQALFCTAIGAAEHLQAFLETGFESWSALVAGKLVSDASRLFVRSAFSLPSISRLKPPVAPTDGGGAGRTRARQDGPAQAGAVRAAIPAPGGYRRQLMSNVNTRQCSFCVRSCQEFFTQSGRCPRLHYLIARLLARCEQIRHGPL